MTTRNWTFTASLAIPNILYRCGRLDGETVCEGNAPVVRIVAMLTRMIERGNQIRQGDIVYGNGYGNENGNEEASAQPEGPDDSQ